MNERLDYLRRRRQLLVSQSAAQRSEVSFVSMNLQQHLRYVDMGFAIVKAIRIHPAMVAASATMLLPSPRNKLLRWSSRLFTAWEIFGLVREQWYSVKKQKDS